MNLLLTCSTTPEFSPEALDLWNKFCIAEWTHGRDIVPYLLFAPASQFASIDAIIFLRPNMTVGFVERPDGSLAPLPEMMPWEAHYFNAAISEEIRNLPESCAMRDGRKWKRIPQIFLAEHGERYQAYDGLDVEFVLDVTERMLSQGFDSPVTWTQIQEIVNRYHVRAMEEYERVGFLVTIDRGLYRVKRAFRKKNSNESEFYFGGKDKRHFHGFVTIGREPGGADYEAWLLEQLLNDPKAGERELHHFFEEHPDFLAEAMMGVPISHQPFFPSNRQTPDFAVSPILPRDSNDWVKLVELKGPEASVLANKRHLHRGLAPAVTQALAQVSDYEQSLGDPLNLRAIEKALGYVPRFPQRAVLIGRTPPRDDVNLWEKRKAEQPLARIITYDLEPKGVAGTFEPLLAKYIRAAEFVVGLASGSIVLLVGSSALHNNGRLPWIFATPLILLAFCVIYGIFFIVLLVLNYENVQHGSPHTKLAYSRSEALGFSTLICFCLGYLLLIFSITR